MPEVRYELIIYWSAPDAAFIVEVPELPGCMADGPTSGRTATCQAAVIRPTCLLAPECPQS